MKAQIIHLKIKAMKAINLKLMYGIEPFYNAIKAAFNSGHKVETFSAACNYAEWLLYDPTTPQYI